MIEFKCSMNPVCAWRQFPKQIPTVFGQVLIKCTIVAAQPKRKWFCDLQFTSLINSIPTLYHNQMRLHRIANACTKWNETQRKKRKKQNNIKEIGGKTIKTQ